MECALEWRGGDDLSRLEKRRCDAATRAYWGICCDFVFVLTTRPPLPGMSSQTQARGDRLTTDELQLHQNPAPFDSRSEMRDPPVAKSMARFLLASWAWRDSSRRRPEANARPLAPEPSDAGDGQRPSA
jgi:hypothetical protein